LFERISRLIPGLLVAVALGGFGWLAVPGVRTEPVKAARSPFPRLAGSLVIGGGGKLPVEITDKFLELAGGRAARIVLIPTARSPALDETDVSKDLAPWVGRSLASVDRLHTRSRQVADDPQFASVLARATGVWISGGSQSRLAEAYGGTEVERQLKALLDRGGVIGGSSAGAAIMTRVMIADGMNEPVEGRGFDFLDGAVVDQHFLKRNRIARLTRLLERHPDLIGFGIDEQTALVVDGRDRRLSVVGNSCVVACLPASAGLPARIEVLKPGDQTPFASLPGSEPEASPAVDLASSRSGL
jgi:cyanophycinase